MRAVDRRILGRCWQAWRFRGFFVIAATVSAGVLIDSAEAVELRPGDILTVGNTFFFDGVDAHEHQAVVHVDPSTYNHVFLSGGGVGVGPEFIGPTGIAVLGNSAVFVADGARVLQVDPLTGSRTILSGAGVGAGEPLSSTHGLWLRDDQSLLVVDRAAQSVLSVDLATGDRTVISSPTVGVGPALLRPFDVTTTLDGRILVASHGTIVADDEFHAFVIAIDPTTGDRSIFSDATHGSGPGYVSALGITRRANGNILVTDNWPAKVFEVDPATGEQTVFSESVPPATPRPNEFISPLGIAEGPAGFVYFSDVDFGVLRIDPAGGWASRIRVLGGGPELSWNYGITVVQVPEPAGMTTLGAGVVVLAAAWRARSRKKQRASIG
jgi:hypothetical protein